MKHDKFQDEGAARPNLFCVCLLCSDTAPIWNPGSLRPERSTCDWELCVVSLMRQLIVP